MTTGHYNIYMKRKIYREDIIKAGLDLMFLHGYNATGIKDITNRIAIPKGSFYNHFSSKEEFGLEVLKFYCDRGLELHKSALLASEDAPLKRLDDFYSGLIADYRDASNCKLGCVMGNFSLELADVNENFRQVLQLEFAKLEAVIVQCLEEAQERGDMNQELNPKLLGSFILNSWHGALVRMKSTGTIKPLEDFKTLIFHQLVS